MHDPKVVIYHHPNPEMRSYLTDEEISSLRVEHFKRPFNKESEDILKSLGHIGAQVVKEIIFIPEVEEVRIKPKEIMVKKGESSSWTGIEEKVMEIIYRAFRRKKITIIKS